MARIVKLSDLSEEERKKRLAQTKKEVQERKELIESQISFKSKNKTDERESKTETLPKASDLKANNNITKSQNSKTRSWATPTTSNKKSLKDIANSLAEHQEEEKEKNKFVNKSGLSTIGNDAKAIGSNLLTSANTGILQFAKTVNMRLDEAENARRESDKKLLETAIKYREEDGEDVSQLKSLLDSDRYKEVDSKPYYQEKIEKLNAKMAENTEKTSNSFSKKIAELSQSLGNNIVGAGITTINPIAGTTYFIGSATGSYYDDAVERGMNEEDAKLYAGIMGSMEGATEAFLSGQNIKGFKSILEGQTAKDTLKAFGIEITENFIQEAVMEPLSELTTKITGGNQYLKNDYRTVDGWKSLLTDSFFSGVDGALSAILLNGATKGVASATKVVNKLNSGAKPTQTEIKTAIKDSEQAGVNVEAVLQEQIINSAEKNLSAQNQNTEQINNTAESIDASLPIQKYKYEKSENVKVDNLRKDASIYFDNSLNTKRYIKMLEQIIADKDIEIRLNGNLTTADGKIANGSYSNGVITINPNSTRAGEFVAIHELTHAIGTEQMKNIINNYRKSNAEFNSAVEALLKNYNTTEINEEALADVSAQLFGNQEFINNLAQSNPNLFQKIYSEIKYLWHQFTGYRNQDQFINDLRYKWEQAYRSNAQLNGTTNYYIENIENFDEIRYNNAKEVKLPKQEYAILSGIVNSDSNIKPGRNYVETTNATYEVYFKETGEFKVVGKIVDGGYNDTITDGTIQRVGNARNAESGMQVYSSDVQQQRTGTHNDEISNINQRETHISDTSVRNGSSNSDNVKYSIAGRKALENIKSNNDLYNQAINMYDKAYDMAKQGKKNDEIIKATGWFKDDTGKLKFSFSDKDMNLKNINYKENSSYALGDILEHDTLFMFYPQLSEYKVEFKDLNKNRQIKDGKLNGSYSRLNKIIRLDVNRANIKQDAEGTLIHEIQHAIQDIEGFTGGTSRKRGKTAYKNSLGEIEARDTANRYIAEKYNHNDLSKILPQSANVDRNILEKMKDGLYNYLNKISGGLSNEETISKAKENSNRDRTLVVDGEYGRIYGGEQTILQGQRATNKPGQPTTQNILARQIENTENSKKGSFSMQNNKWQSYLNKNFEAKGTMTNLKDITLPKANMSKEKIDILTDKDYEVLNKIYEKEGRTEVLTEKKKAKLLEKYASDKYKLKESIDILAQKIVNKGHYIDKLSEKSKNPELKFIYDKNLNSFAEGQYSIGVAQTDNNGKVIGKSINDIWKPIEESNLSKEFSEYLLHKHNIDRSGRKKYVFGEEIGPTESTAIALDLEQKHPEFKKYAEDIKKFNHNNLENMKEAGLITQEAIDYMESMYPNYIPISRDIENSIYTGNNDKTGANSPIKKATGGNSDIQPIKDAMAQQTIRLKRLVNQNNLGKELAKTLKNAKVEEGVDIEMTPSLLFDIETMVETDSEGNKYYTYFENGKQQKIKIDDTLYESLIPTEIGKWENTLPIKALQKVTSIHRSLLTSSNPLFVVTNFFKDFQDGMFNSKYSSKFIKNYGKALSEIVTKGKYYQSYMANGGMTNTYFDYNEGMKKKKNKFVEKIRNVNEIVEQLPRLAEFISTLEDGKSLNEALYNSAEITTNFKRGGDITKALNRNGVNFLNASIQGLDKQFRNLKGQNGIKGYANLLVKATIMSIAPSVLNHMLLDDDEDYQDLPQSTKDLYYLFKYDDGKFIRIPKGRVLSIFGAVARRTVETVQGQEDAWKGFKDTLINQVAPNNPLEDNILSPISQVKNNKTWYGTDLVSSRLQQELPKNQYDETTDELSKWLGSKLNISPKKINYLLDQYSGALGDILLPIITPQAKQNVIADKFTTDSVLKNKNVSAFYETLEKQTQIANDSFSTEEDEIQLKYLNSISRSMSDLYKEKREVQMSDISNKEKTKKVREIQEQINQLAEEGLNNYKNTTQGENYSKVGDEEYYKNSSGEWTKVSAEEKEKMGNISLETFSDYKQKLYDEKNNKVASGELKKTQDLKDKDKINILLESNYSTKEKQELYENYIMSSEDAKYPIIKETFTSSGLNINKYLQYKSQDFESTKKDDGTVKGKTVYGSKKQKVINYINSIEGATYTQKLILSALEYEPSKNSDKQLIVNYVKNLSNKTAEEKLDILGTFKGVTIYKNGNYKW